jgi:hypothetical protein
LTFRSNLAAEAQRSPSDRDKGQFALARLLLSKDIYIENLQRSFDQAIGMGAQ